MTGPVDPRIARVREVFEDWARRGRAEGMERSHAPFVRQAFSQLELTEDAWYLDIGCGSGYTVRWAADAAPGGRAIGIDVSPVMIRLARSLSSAVPHTAFAVAAFPSHPLPRGAFDAVLSMEVFYYLPDLHAALEEVRRLLKPGGRFACIVDFYEENAASRSWPADVGLPMTRLSVHGWRDAVARAGFEIVGQSRLTVPVTEASEPWKATEGSLLTIGRRPIP